MNEHLGQQAEDVPVIVTRHVGAADWLRQRGVRGKVLSHITSPEQIRGKVVYGILPLDLAAKAAEVVTIDMPRLKLEDRGRDLSPEEMDKAGATLRRYRVTALMGLTREVGDVSVHP